MENDKYKSYALEDMLKMQAPPPPDDFEAFWRGMYAKATAKVPAYRVEKEIWSPDPDVTIYQLRFTNYDGFEIGMWIARPKESTGGLMIGQGYGNLATPPTAPNPGLTIALPNVRGLGISQCREIPWMPAQHAGYGVHSREQYVITGAITDIWAGISVMADMFPDTASNISYTGGSLGGGMGAILIPWDSRIKAGELNVPTLAGPMQFAYATPGDGDPGSVRAAAAAADPKCLEALSYLDGASAVKHIRVPILMTPALSDHSNPPPAQFAIANAIPDAWRILRVREVGHREPTPKDVELEKELVEIRKTIFSSDRRGEFAKFR